MKTVIQIILTLIVILSIYIGYFLGIGNLIKLGGIVGFILISWLILEINGIKLFKNKEK